MASYDEQLKKWASKHFNIDLDHITEVELSITIAGMCDCCGVDNIEIHADIKGYSPKFMKAIWHKTNAWVNLDVYDLIKEIVEA